MPTPAGSYNIVRTNVSTTTAITVIQLATPATAMAEVTRAWGNQSSSTTSTATALGLIRKSAAATVTARTPDPDGPNQQAAKCVGGVNLTGITATVEGTDASNYLWSEGFNIVGNGVLFLPVPEERIMLGVSGFLGLKHSVAPTGNWNHGISWLEY